jgi:uncharacterized protein (DUF4415 family)
MKDSYDFSAAKRGAVAPSTGKTRITIWVDDDALAVFRRRGEQEGRGYQTLINEALKAAADDAAPARLERALRKIIREEMRAH